jgi:LPS-assembly lipoprotein
MRALLITLVFLMMTGCGFQLRGAANLPWDTLHIGLPENTPLYHQIKRSIESGSHTRVVGDPKDAQASLTVLQNTHNKAILSLSAKGLVREFQLTRSFVYRIQDAKGNELIPASQIILQREMGFDDERIFAKEAEEALIVREMEQDLVVQLLRRLTASSRLVKP